MTSFADRAGMPGAAQSRAGGSRVHRSASHVPRPPWAPVQRMERAGSASKKEPSGPAPAPNRAGLPDRLKAGVEALSGLAMDDVRVHRNSTEPVKLGALAFTKGSDIHLGPDQEEHLPHEAWHVVQQKQGRVKATAQLKGVAINEDATLEAEADRMGGTSARDQTSAAGSMPRAAPARSTVIQGKIRAGIEDLAIPKTGCSKVIAQYINAKETYIMRNDWNKASGFFDTTIHLLDGWRKYLLGELHNISAWGTMTSKWHVSKIEEGLSYIPGAEPKRDESAVDEKIPLENTHTVSLQYCLVINNALNIIQGKMGSGLLVDLLAGRIVFGWPAKKHTLADGLQLIMKYINAMIISERRTAVQYLYFYMDVLASGRKLSNSDRHIFSFAKALLYTYSPAMEKLKNHVLDMRAMMQLGDIGVIAAHASELYVPWEEYGTVTRKMIEDLTKIIGIKDGSDEAKLVKQVAARSDAFHPKTAVALLQRRDREMAERINGTRAPLLAGLGQGHLDGVLPLVKGAKLALRQGDDLEIHTKREAP